MVKHPHYETGRDRQSDPARYVICSGAGKVRTFEVFETDKADAVRRAVSDFVRFFGALPESAEVL